MEPIFRSVEPRAPTRKPLGFLTNESIRGIEVALSHARTLARKERGRGERERASELSRCALPINPTNADD